MDSHYPIGEAVWAAAAIILLFAFGDILVLLALALVIAGAAAAWVAYRQAQHDAAVEGDELGGHQGAGDAGCSGGLALR